MKSLSDIYENMLDRNYVICTTYLAFSGKKKTEQIRRFLDSDNIGDNADLIIEGLRNGTLPRQYSRYPKIIHEPAANKDRIIYPPSNEEHVIHHLVCKELEPLFMQSMYEFCVASVPNRGDLYGKKFLEKWIKKSKDTPLYVLKLDIHHFFDSVDRTLLEKKLSKKIKDKKFLEVLHKIIWYDGDMNGIGIPIGFYTSQWFANFYLQDFDYFLKQDLRVRYYMRYMDDIVILEPDKQKLWSVFYQAKDYLETKLFLEINDNWQLFRFSYPDFSGKEKGRAIDFMGYVFHFNRTVMRKKTLSRVRKKANKIARHEHITWYESTQMISRVGRMQHCHTYGYFSSWIKPKIDLGTLKDIVSRYGKRIAKERKEG